MINEIKKMINNFKLLDKKFPEMDGKEKSKIIWLTIYYVFFTILMRFPISLIREATLYFMTVYEVPHINTVATISRIIVEVLFIIVAINYFPKTFNKLIDRLVINKVETKEVPKKEKKTTKKPKK